ncbi:MAG: hypothetical protein ACQESG_07410 [Nanobdellota archaeon]
MKQQALLLIVLIISIPFCISNAYAEVNTEEPQDVENYDLCMRKADKVAQDIEEENSQIKTFETVAFTARSICSVMTLITKTLAILGTIIGMGAESGGCCYSTNIAACQSLGPIYNIFDAQWYTYAQFVCAYVSNGWCAFGPQLMDDLGLPMGQTIFNGINSYDSIYIAMGCINLVAIIYHQRQLLNLKIAKECCIRDACAKGYSTEECDQMYEYQECIYTKGGIAKAVSSMIIAAISAAVSYVIMETIGVIAIPGCVRVILEIIAFPSALSSLQESVDMLSQAGSGPDCGDFDFSDVEPQDYTSEYSTYEEPPAATGIQEGTIYTDGDTYYLIKTTYGDQIEVASLDTTGTHASHGYGYMAENIQDAQTTTMNPSELGSKVGLDNPIGKLEGDEIAIEDEGTIYYNTDGETLEESDVSVPKSPNTVVTGSDLDAQISEGGTTYTSADGNTVTNPEGTTKVTIDEKTVSFNADGEVTTDQVPADILDEAQDAYEDQQDAIQDTTITHTTDQGTTIVHNKEKTYSFNEDTCTVKTEDGTVSVKTIDENTKELKNKDDTYTISKEKNGETIVTDTSKQEVSADKAEEIKDLADETEKEVNNAKKGDPSGRSRVESATFTALKAVFETFLMDEVMDEVEDSCKEKIQSSKEERNTQTSTSSTKRRSLSCSCQKEGNQMTGGFTIKNNETCDLRVTLDNEVIDEKTVNTGATLSESFTYNFNNQQSCKIFIDNQLVQTFPCS